MSEAGMEENSIKNYDIESWQEVILIYRSALKQVETKMEILNDEFQHVHQYNPIEHIKSRIKTPESIVRKLNRYGSEPTISNMVDQVNDIAGIRLICSFTSDIYELANIIAQQKDIHVLSVKDYIRYPKQSGYRSYHMIITIPVYLTEKTVRTKVEIQIRTVAMDFWASLEHKIKYKFEGTIPEEFRDELLACSKMVADLDSRMETINVAIQDLNQKEEDEEDVMKAIESKNNGDDPS
ncbi:MAG: GTP pyrophosphokinase family protein [Lachnospiraceae bacterium]|nr:GTP pyrophosphokinase family protein [Lachnospiraceae bacterium]